MFLYSANLRKVSNKINKVSERVSPGVLQTDTDGYVQAKKSPAENRRGLFSVFVTQLVELSEFNVIRSPLGETLALLRLLEVGLHACLITLACGDDGLEICTLRAVAADC